MRIAVAGAGHVGLRVATLLARYNHVELVDIIPEKVEMINRRISPIQDESIEKCFREMPLYLYATLDGASAYRDAEIVVIAVPTIYDSINNTFDTKNVERVIELVLSVNPNATIVISSIVPVGYTESIRKKYHINNILFYIELLKESNDHIVIGSDIEQREQAEVFVNLLKQSALNEDIPVSYMSLTEAESLAYVNQINK